MLLHKKPRGNQAVETVVIRIIVTILLAFVYCLLTQWLQLLDLEAPAYYFAGQMVKLNQAR